MSVPKEYRVLRGLNWPAEEGVSGDWSATENRVERGDMVRDLPPALVNGLIADGVIESLDEEPAVEAVAAVATVKAAESES